MGTTLASAVSTENLATAERLAAVNDTIAISFHCHERHFCKYKVRQTRLRPRLCLADRNRKVYMTTTEP